MNANRHHVVIVTRDRRADDGDIADSMPSPETVRRVSPEGRPAEMDHFGKRSLHELMALPFLLGALLALVVGLAAGIVAGLAAFAIGAAMGAAFNPVFWASGARAEERAQASRAESRRPGSRDHT